jgi:hypothetical protein
MNLLKPVNRLVLGHMPMVGVSYQSIEKDITYKKKFSEIREIKKVLDTAYEDGINKFATATPGPNSLEFLHFEALKHLVNEGKEVELIPCVGIPVKVGESNVNAFRRWATYLSLEKDETPDVTQNVLNDPILNFREGWKIKLPVSRPYEKEVYNRIKIDWKKLEGDLEYFRELPVSYIEPGSETDFLTLVERFDLLGELLDRIKEGGCRGVLLGVHHAGITIPMLDEVLDNVDGYVTPLNSLGIMMFPTKTSAEEAIKNTKKTVYAIKPLAGGRLTPEKAFEYVFRFDVDYCIFGAASITEVREDAAAAIKIISEMHNC